MCICDGFEKNKIYCVDCKHLIKRSNNTATYLYYLCSVNKDFIKKEPLLCDEFNANGDCEKYEEK